MRSSAKRFYLAVFALFAAGPVSTLSSPSYSGPASHESCAIDPKAIVSDACASFSTLDTLNTDLRPTIQSLTQNSDFFSYYRLNLYNRVCPFWSDDSGMCGNIACAVNTIENEEEIPFIWRAEELGKLEGPSAHHPNRQLQQAEKPLMGGLGEEVGESCVVEYDDECDQRDYCVPEDESATAKGDYVSLIENPERFTGYSGPSANHVWEAIYRENCFTKESSLGSSLPQSSPFGANPAQLQASSDLRNVMRSASGHVTSRQEGFNDHDDLILDEQCLEKRVFYRVISGMHASISTHLCWDFLNQTTGKWGPNVQCYEQRLHNHPDRISNLYFNYALVLRAVAKVRNVLAGYTFCSGDPAQDRATKTQVLALADMIASGPRIYDESLMFQDSSVAGLKDDFRVRFRNVSRTMDCVGCDKCRLWGKLQTAGYGTALKILFEFDERDLTNNPPLRRTEVVALINTLDKLSHALSSLGKFESMREIGNESTEVPPASPLVESPQSTAASNVDDDDGLPDRADSDTNGEPRLKDEFISEFALVMRTAKWVVQQWLKIPRLILDVVAIWLSYIWNFWLGVPQERQMFTWSLGWSPASPPGMKRDEL